MFTETLIAGFRIHPNPKLKAERAWSYEIGVHGMLGLHLSLDVAIFRNEYRDMIEPEPVKAGEGYQMANLTRSSIRGVECIVRGQAGQGLLSGEISYVGVDPRDLDSDQPLPYRSRHRWRSSVALNYGPGQLSLDFRYASRAEEVEVYPSDDRVSQYVLDLGARMRLGSCTLAVKVDNLLQYHYAEIERNLAPIRSYTLTLTGTR
jgi:outer membrane cobalamin receptor